MKPIVSNIPWLGLAVLAFIGGRQSQHMSPPDPFETSSRDSVRGALREAPANGASARAGFSPLSLEELTGGPEWNDSGEISGSRMRQWVNEISRCQDPLRQEVLFSRLLARLSQSNADAAWEGLRSCSHDDPDASRRLEMFGYAWGVLQGEVAMMTAMGGEGHADRILASSALEGWAVADPDAAMAFMRSELRVPTMSCRLGFLRGLARSRPEAAADYLSELDDYTDAGPYIRPVIDAQIRIGYEKAQEWVMDLSTGSLKEKGLQILAERRVGTDPEQAAEWASSLAHEPVAKELVATVAEHFMKETTREQESLRFALEWMAGLPDGEVKDAAYEKSVRAWARRDPNAAAGCLMAMPSSESKDSALRGFALEVSLKDPSSAVLWAATIDGAELRHRTLIPTVRQWLLRDPEGANAWLATAGLPERTLRGITSVN